MKKLYIVYFYTPDGEKDSDVFVADSQIDLENQFLLYSKCTYGTMIEKSDVDYIDELGIINDSKGNKYNISIREK